MKIYILMDAETGKPLFAAWTSKSASEKAAGLKAETYLLEVPIDPLSGLVNDYFQHRRYHDPNAFEAFLFFISEIGEFAGAWVQKIKDRWVRNNNHEDDSVEDEAGDMLMMYLKLMEKMEINPFEAMLDKWRRKGWSDN